MATTNEPTRMFCTKCGSESLTYRTSDKFICPVCLPRRKDRAVSNHVEFLRKINCSETADYIEQLEERLRITNELLEAKQEPNNAQ